MRLITIPLHISTALYVLIMCVFPALLMLVPMDGLSEEDRFLFKWLAIGVPVMSLPLIIFIEIVAYQLKKGRFWAWIAAICLAALYLPSLFFFLGIPMFIGLFHDEVREHCREKKAPPGAA